MIDHLNVYREDFQIKRVPKYEIDFQKRRDMKKELNERNIKRQTTLTSQQMAQDLDNKKSSNTAHWEQASYLLNELKQKAKIKRATHNSTLGFH